MFYQLASKNIAIFANNLNWRTSVLFVGIVMDPNFLIRNQLSRLPVLNQDTYHKF